MIKTLEEKYSPFNCDILFEEYQSFRNEVNSYNKETPYYVYALCEPDGIPFYIGKGKGMRGWDHFKSKINKNKISRINSFGEEPFIVHLIKGGLTQEEAYELEKEEISYYGRLFDDSGILTNLMPGGEHLDSDLSRIGGKIGGKRTKENSSGIFSEKHDRSKETRRRWETGILNRDCFNGFEHCKKAAAASVESGKGIHAEDFDHSGTSKKNWAKLKADPVKYEEFLRKNRKTAQARGARSKELGTNFSSWDPEKQREVASKGGKITGSIPMWTNGSENKRSHECPGEGWFRGVKRKLKGGTIEVLKFKEKK